MENGVFAGQWRSNPLPFFIVSTLRQRNKNNARHR